jgi:hypothetical protein
MSPRGDRPAGNGLLVTVSIVVLAALVAGAFTVRAFDCPVCCAKDQSGYATSTQFDVLCRGSGKVTLWGKCFASRDVAVFFIDP